MAIIQKVKVGNEWVPVSRSNVNSGSGGITEEKEVYIGADEPTDDGAKLWIDPTGTPSGGNGGGNASEGVSSEPVITLYLPTFGEDYVDPLEDKYRELNAASFNTIIQYGREKGIIPRIFLLEQEFAYAKENGYEVYGGYIPYQALVIGVGEEIGIAFGFAYSTGSHDTITLLPTGEWTKSCAEGRDEFIKRNKAHDDDMFTVSEFFDLTKNYWGSDIIERVESKMKSLDKHE